MRRSLIAVAVLTFVVAGGTLAEESGGEPTAEAILHKHLEAHGGAERWNAVRSLKIEGTWTAFSEEGSMTIWRMRPDLYRFDHTLVGGPATLAYDGEKVWIQSAVFGAPNGQEVTDSWKRNVVLDAAFSCPLLHHAAGGAGVELAGQEKVEGEDVYVLKVTPGEAPEETWYLDAGTFLETKRVSRVFDVFSGPGVEVDMETYYTDFREVDGVTIPHRDERHFGVRYHVYEASKIQINPELDGGVFRIPEKKEEKQKEETGAPAEGS